MTSPSVASGCSSCCSFRLFCAFLLWPGCQASPHQPCHLGSGQTTTSITDKSCYCHCNDYSSDGELQCRLMIIESFPQSSVLGSPLHLLNMMTLSPSRANFWHCLMRDHWSVFIFPSTLCGLWNAAFHLVNGSDKLEIYTHSLRS